MAPRPAATGAHSRATSSGTSNIATSTPSNTSASSPRTVRRSPRTASDLPTERAEATRRISPHTLAREESRSHMTVPTAPVAPTTANVGRADTTALPSGSGVDDRFGRAGQVEGVVQGAY